MIKKNAIVIGAGVGGLAIAAKLARDGYKVTVFEKNNVPGGCCGQLRKEGHYFDTGPTFFIFPDVYKALFSSLGEKIEDHLTLLRVDPNDQLIFEDGFRLSIFTDLYKMYQQLEKIEPGSFHNYIRYLVKSEYLYNESLKKIISKEFFHFWEYFSLPNILSSLKLYVFTSHYKFVEKYVHSPYLKAALTFQDFYAGMSPSNAPATFSMFSYSEIAHGIFLPKGGMYKVTEALFSICKKNGVEFKFNSPITRIIAGENLVKSVVSANGESYSADLVISDADMPHAYQDLLPPSTTAKELKKKQFSSSVLTFFWATKKKYPQLQTHNLFFSNDYCGNFDAISNSKDLPDDPHIYVHCASRTDTTAAPANNDSITVIVPVGHINPENPQNWNKLIPKLRKYALKRLKSVGITDLEKNIKFEIIHTPSDFQKRYNLTYGATLGFHHKLTQMGYLRPHKKHKKYKNLYFVGSNTHPGGGVPTVLLSADFAYQHIKRDEG